MKSTFPTYWHLYNSTKFSNFVQPYYTYDNSYDYCKNMNIAPAGSMLSTVTDLSQYAMMLLNYGNYCVNFTNGTCYQYNTLMDQQTATSMFQQTFTNSPNLNGIGSIWWQYNRNNVPYWAHDGDL